MARGGARAGSGRPVISELQQNGDPPKSTLAAQLVNQFTDGKKHSRNQDQETFRQLLQEILGTRDEQQSQTETFEPNCMVNYKLVYVIFKAGLESMQPEDPLGQNSDQYKQAIDSLAAVQRTIRRNPEVLFATLPDMESDPQLKGPLFLWLVPKVLSLTGYMKHDAIRNGVIQLLKTAIIVERRLHVKEAKRHGVLKYLKGCIKG